MHFLVTVGFGSGNSSIFQILDVLNVFGVIITSALKSLSLIDIQKGSWDGRMSWCGVESCAKSDKARRKADNLAELMRYDLQIVRQSAIGKLDEISRRTRASRHGGSIC